MLSLLWIAYFTAKLTAQRPQAGKHAAGPASGIADAAFVGGEHFDETAHDAGRGVELMNAPAFTLRAAFGSLFRSARMAAIFALDAVDGAVCLLPLAGSGEHDACDQIDEFAEAVFVEAWAGEIFRQDAFEARVVALDGDLGVVHGHGLADTWLLGPGLEVGPAGIGGHPEGVPGFVLLSASALPLRAACGRLSRSARLVGVFRNGPCVFSLYGQELGPVFLEGVGDVFEEDEPEDDVLVLSRIHVVPQLVRSEPELGLKADGGGGVAGLRLAGCFSCHSGDFLNQSGG